MADGTMPHRYFSRKHIVLLRGCYPQRIGVRLVSNTTDRRDRHVALDFTMKLVYMPLRHHLTVIRNIASPASRSRTDRVPRVTRLCTNLVGSAGGELDGDDGFGRH